jgi:hypothetical protein
MNTGHRLASLSGLPSGSALAHLMAAVTGTGTGETIYAHRMEVSTRQPTHRVTPSPRADSLTAKAAVRRVTSRTVERAGALMSVTPTDYVFTSGVDALHIQKLVPELWVLTTVEELYTSL